ncbi:MAG: carboxypeptidase-like regulatory domain-containing protein, partial [bacterium]
MIRKNFMQSCIIKFLFAALIMLMPAMLFGAQQTMKIVMFPFSGVLSDREIEIGVASATLDSLDSVRVWFGPTPGGSKRQNYDYRANVFYRTKADSVDPVSDTIVKVNDEKLQHLGPLSYNWVKPVRGDNDIMYVKFRPNLQHRLVNQSDTEYTMLAGRYYYMIEAIDKYTVKMGTVNVPRRDTVVSDELFFIVETDQAAEVVSPGIGDVITTMAPFFEWKRVPGVPYYHMMLSDQLINLDSLSGASLIWQAITPNTNILYGTPDPSGLFPNAPPLSPDVQYQWLVLNNYGGEKEFTSRNALPSDIPSFTIDKPITIKFPRGNDMIMDVYGINKTSNNWTKMKPESDTIGRGSFYGDSIKFQWSAADKGVDTARLYKIYLYIFLSSEDSGSNPMDNADVLISQYENTTTSNSIVIDAKSFMLNMRYFWKVFAEQDDGAAITTDTASFMYYINDVKVNFSVRESLMVAGRDTVLAVPLVPIDVEALDGSLNNVPLMTDNKGNGTKVLPAGNYRFTTNKAGYIAQSRTVFVDSTNNSLTFIIERSPSTLFGQVLDSKRNGLDQALIMAVSDRGDTSVDSTDSKGSYILNVNDGKWTLSASKVGYQPSVPKIYSMGNGQDSLADTIFLTLNPYSIKGKVTNINGSGLARVDVSLNLGGKVINNALTDGGGNYLFVVTSNVFSIQYKKDGFITQLKKDINVTSSKIVDVTLKAGAAFISGSVINAANTKVVGVKIIASPHEAGLDTVETETDNLGKFKLSLEGGKYYNLTFKRKGYR